MHGSIGRFLRGKTRKLEVSRIRDDRRTAAAAAAPAHAESTSYFTDLYSLHREEAPRAVQRWPAY